MLLALLLSLLPPALPMAAFQDPAPAAEPFLQWDRETEDAYRRALHLWQVRGKPGEAADILLKLADGAEVTQVAGQASWVLVLAAQALAEAGRTDEASALIPGIERGARGTALSDPVYSELTKLRQLSGMEQTALDQRFLSMLIEILNTPDGNSTDYQVFDRVSVYRRAVLPYFIEIVKSWPNQITGRRAIGFGLGLADAAFVDSLLDLLNEVSTLQFITTLTRVHYQELDELASRERARFWSTLAKHKDEDRVRIAKQALSTLAFSYHSPFALQAIRDLLQDADPRQDLELLIWPPRMDLTADPGVQFILELAKQPKSPTVSRARDLLCLGDHLDALEELAEKGDREDVTRYLACLFLNFNSAVSFNAEAGTTVALSRILRAEGLSGILPEFRNQTVTANTPPHARFRGFDLAKPFLDAAHYRTLVALAAAGIRDEAGLNLAYAKGVPDDEVTLCFVLGQRKFLPTVFLPRARVLAAQPLTADSAWSLISDQAPDSLNVELLRSVGTEIQQRQYGNMIDQLIRKGRAAEVLQIAKDESFSAELRSRAVGRYTGSQRLSWLVVKEIFSIYPALPERDRRSTLEKILSEVEILINAADSGLEPSVVAEILRASKDAGSSCNLLYSLDRNWPFFGEKVVRAFGISLDDLLWLKGNHNNRQTIPGFVLLCLEQGAPLDWFFILGADNFLVWIPDRSPYLIDVARVLLARGDPRSRRVALRELLRVVSEAPLLWSEVEPCWSEPELASLAALAMAQVPDRSTLVDRMIQAWSMPGLQNRSMMIQAMTATADPRLAPHLLSAIADPDATVALEAQRGLERLKEIEEQRAFWESWQATGVGGSPTAALLKQIQSKNKEVRLSAIRALGLVKDPQALPLLISLLEDPDPEVVAAARAGLAWLQADAPK